MDENAKHVVAACLAIGYYSSGLLKTADKNVSVWAAGIEEQVDEIFSLYKRFLSRLERISDPPE